MELRHLRYFVAVAQELHFGRAAKGLQMAQQPLSRQIRDLEREIGVQLFYRTKRTVRLTEAGQVFLDEAQKTLQQSERAVLLAQQADRGEIGRLAIGFTGAALNSLLPKAVRSFKEQYPKIELRLERLSTNEQVEALIAGRIQVGLLHPPIENDAISLELLYKEKLIAFLPDSHSLAQETPDAISLKTLSKELFIFYPRHIGPTLYDRIINLCQQSGFSPHVVQEVFPQQTILGLVAAGIGISLLHSSARAIAPAGVVHKRLIEPTPALELAVAWHSETSHPIRESFLQVVRRISEMLLSQD